MTTKTTYIADDSSEFSTRLACLNYEAMCKQVSEIMSELQPPPTDIFEVAAWEQGLAYIPHNADTFEAVSRAMAPIFEKWGTSHLTVQLAAQRIRNTRYHTDTFQREYREWYLASNQNASAKPLPHPKPSNNAPIEILDWIKTAWGGELAISVSLNVPVEAQVFIDKPFTARLLGGFFVPCRQARYTADNIFYSCC